MNIPSGYINNFRQLLAKKNIDCVVNKNEITCASGVKKISLLFPEDLLVTAPKKLAAIVQSRLSLNQRIFARNCEVKKIRKETAENFLNEYHLMNSTSSAYNYGLFFNEELVAAASFSKGRKMNRLQAHKRSFELIRFCCKDGISVSGGLTRLVAHFCREKQAGDVMTYIDKQFSNGESFIKAGFKKAGETLPNYFLVNRFTFERTPAREDTVFNPEKFSLRKNDGNLKLIFTCE